MKSETLQDDCMPKYWVIDTKVRVLPRSSLPQDGSDYYFVRSVVLDSSKDNAIDRLRLTLEEDFIYIDEIIIAVDYESENWDTHLEDFDIKNTFELVQASDDIYLGCFISESAMWDSEW
ncbi:hypothetical protein OOZ15_00400 [Galbibacter sp. EGI 63066]|uniref:hypothetical protein n=1 Tax=Galbibacter sp. EGI 63066 TaxID=2993559 RepID=UPI002248C26C|nr:hypothetical protein [Galbibacter sp. EGI 63066]MCX2678388.1 hypothetical protein [Galbibacter sp. EGI 63066]